MDTPQGQLLYINIEFSKLCDQPFLARNMKRALDHHEKGNPPVKTTRESNIPWRPAVLKGVRERDRPGWLELALGGLPHIKSGGENGGPPPVKRVRLADEDVHIDCNVRLRVVVRSASLEQPESRYDEKYPARLNLHTNAQGHCSAKIESKKSFKVDQSCLLTWSRPEGSAMTKTLAEDILLRIELDFNTPQDYATFFDEMGGLGVPKGNVPKFEFLTGYIKLKEHFVLAGPGSKLMRIYTPVNVTKNHKGKILMPSHKLRVSAEWKALPASHGPLSTYNNVLKRVEQSSRPAAQKRSTIVHKNRSCHVEYIFQHLKDKESKKFASCTCYICEASFDSLDRLELHLKTTHPLLEFTVGSKQANDEMTVTITVSSFAGQGEQTSSKEEINYVAPPLPFKVKDYLVGDNSWLHAGDRRKARVTTSDIVGIVEDNEPAEMDEGVESHQRNEVDDPPLQLADITREVQRWPVPPAPEGRVFYRSSNKRPLAEGEMVSESDDDIDESWVAKKERSFTRSERVTPAQKAFMAKWDEHMNAEVLNGKAYVMSAVLRFFSKNAEWLRVNKLQAEAKQKTRELEEDDFISEQQHTDLVSRGYFQDSGQSTEHDRRTAEPGATLSRSGVEKDMTIVSSPRPSISTCTCGKPVLGVRGIVICTKVECRREYHVRCIDSPSVKEPGWTCAVHVSEDATQQRLPTAAQKEPNATSTAKSIPERKKISEAAPKSGREATELISTSHRQASESMDNKSIPKNVEPKEKPHQSTRPDHDLNAKNAERPQQHTQQNVPGDKNSRIAQRSREVAHEKSQAFRSAAQKAERPKEVPVPKRPLSTRAISPISRFSRESDMVQRGAQREFAAQQIRGANVSATSQGRSPKRIQIGGLGTSRDPKSTNGASNALIVRSRPTNAVLPSRTKSPKSFPGKAVRKEPPVLL